MNIVDYISKDIQLTQKGPYKYFGSCPFHKEKTPSFLVNADTGVFYCFGCKVKGDLVQYIVLRDNLTYEQAVDKIGHKKHVKTNHVLMNEEFQSWCQQHLLGETLDYLLSRGITKEVINQYKIGFCNGKYVQEIYRYLKDKYQDISSLFSINHDRVYCYFDNRITFPIIDQYNDCIAFGARTINNHKIKYLNTGHIFNKKKHLYGFLKRGEVVMVEGYMDVLALASAGYQGSVVAVLSAHISIEQLDLAWRFSKTPIIALDNDLAGFSGMVKIATEALPEINADKSLKFLNIKNSKDPDEFIRKYGINQWYQVIQDHSITLADFILMINTPSDHSPHQQLQYKNNINNLLKTIKDKDTKNEYYTYFNVLNNKNQYTLELIKNKFYINNQNAVVNRSLQALQIIYNHLEDLDDETIEILSQIKLINEDIDILRNSIVMHYSFRDNINQSNKSKIKRCLNICLLDIIQYEIQLLSNQLVLNENSTLEKQLFVLKNHELNLIQEIKDNIK